MPPAVDQPARVAAKSESAPKPPWTLIAVILLVAIGAGGGAAWMVASRVAAPDAAADADASSAPTPAATPAPALYFALEPPFVVNLAEAEEAQYLQVEVQLMTRDPEALKAIETHTPAIRNRLLMLFSQQRARDIGDRGGKERLQATALTEVQRLLEAETGKPGAEALLFTSFVTQ